MDAGTALIVIVLIALPIGAIVFALGAGNAFSQIGKGDMSIEQEMPQGSGSLLPPASPEERAAEIRQMVQARSYRRETRGEAPLDIEAEVGKLLYRDRSPLGADRGLRDEVRQLVVARNERRVRQGKSELDVEAEVERQLRELEGLGQ